jgi:succinyl-CoA synthetase beta subunit
MRLFEYEAKEIFRSFGIPTPKEAIANSPADVASAVEKVGLPLVIKAQVLVGGRGRAGGIKFVESLEEAVKETENLLSSKLRGGTL